MSETQMLVGAVVVIVIAAIFIFRRKLSVRWKFLGSDLEIKGENDSKPQKSGSLADDGADGTVASGKGAVAIGGNVNGATIVTGNNSSNTQRGNDK